MKMDEPYTDLYLNAIRKTIRATQDTINRKAPLDEIKRQAMEVVVLYKLLDNARKLQYNSGWGVPNISSGNIDYKVVMNDPLAEKAEKLYKILKLDLNPGYLNP
jgi:hypothetical protein